MTTVVLAPVYTGHFWADEFLTPTTRSHGMVQFLSQIAALFTLVRLIKQRRITRLHWGFYRANCAKTCPVEERLPFFKEISVKNFWQMVLDLKTKRGMGKSCTICKTPDNEWAWVETDHLPPYEQAWHWLTRQMVQRISVVLVKKAKR